MSGSIVVTPSVVTSKKVMVAVPAPPGKGRLMVTLVPTGVLGASCTMVQV